jgi:hypothetical protein
MINYFVDRVGHVGDKTIGIGLTHEELYALARGEILLIDMDRFGMHGNICVFAGKNDEALKEKISTTAAKDFGLEITHFDDPEAMGRSIREIKTRRN